MQSACEHVSGYMRRIKQLPDDVHVLAPYGGDPDQLIYFARARCDGNTGRVSFRLPSGDVGCIVVNELQQDDENPVAGIAYRFQSADIEFLGFARREKNGLWLPLGEVLPIIVAPTPQDWPNEPFPYRAPCSLIWSKDNVENISEAAQKCSELILKALAYLRRHADSQELKFLEEVVRARDDPSRQHVLTKWSNYLHTIQRLHKEASFVLPLAFDFVPVPVLSSSAQLFNTYLTFHARDVGLVGIILEPELVALAPRTIRFLPLSQKDMLLFGCVRSSDGVEVNWLSPDVWSYKRVHRQVVSVQVEHVNDSSMRVRVPEWNPHEMFFVPLPTEMRVARGANLMGLANLGASQVEELCLGDFRQSRDIVASEGS